MPACNTPKPFALAELVFSRMRGKCCGSPYDRGDSDAYYGRRFRPHKRLDGLGRREATNLTEAEIAEYARGYEENPSGQKDWG